MVTQSRPTDNRFVRESGWSTRIRSAPLISYDEGKHVLVIASAFTAFIAGALLMAVSAMTALWHLQRVAQAQLRYWQEQSVQAHDPDRQPTTDPDGPTRGSAVERRQWLTLCLTIVTTAAAVIQTILAIT